METPRTTVRAMVPVSLLACAQGVVEISNNAEYSRTPTRIVGVTMRVEDFSLCGAAYRERFSRILTPKNHDPRYVKLNNKTLCFSTQDILAGHFCYRGEEHAFWFPATPVWCHKHLGRRCPDLVKYKSRRTGHPRTDSALCTETAVPFKSLLEEYRFHCLYDIRTNVFPDLFRETHKESFGIGVSDKTSLGRFSTHFPRSVETLDVSLFAQPRETIVKTFYIKKLRGQFPNFHTYAAATL